MLFNSYEFLFAYLPVVFLVYFVLASKNTKASAVWLAIASIFFYGWWNPKFVFLLLASIGYNFFAGVSIANHAHQPRGKATLIMAIVANLGLLILYKYANFFVATALTLGVSSSLKTFDLLLPLGISFFTFTQIAFLVDAYQGKAKEHNFIHYTLFVTWFPHLIAGPVLHHKQMMPQFALQETYRPNPESIAVGFTIFSIGLFKKVILADQFALYANPVFEAAHDGAPLAFLEAWAGALNYTLQLYFDFSGYSDMAIGLSRIFNIKLPLNFNSPYKSPNIIEFWRRWHMTLSKFLQDYLYVPLGGNRKGAARRYSNLMATMVLGGLWHGAGWNFVLWGALHGAYLIVNHLWRALCGARTDKAIGMGMQTQPRFLKRIGVLITFLAVAIAWVPFRSADIATAAIMLKAMLGGSGLSLSQSTAPFISAILGDYVTFSGFAPQTFLPSKSMTVWVPIGLVFVWAFPNTQELMAKFSPAWQEVIYLKRYSWVPSRRSGIFVGLVFAATVIAFKKNSPFLYFQF
jgi:alginate O-acetyltransferase complex protein AlgI